MFVSLANQPDPFPMPDQGERWSEYAQRWDAWSASIGQSDRAWAEVLSVQRELSASRENGTLDLSWRQSDEARAKNARFLSENPDLFRRLHSAATRPALGVTSAGNHDPDHVEHLRQLGQEPPDRFDGPLEGSTLNLTVPHADMLRDQTKYVLLVMDHAFENHDRGTVVGCFEALEGLVRFYQEPPIAMHFLIAAATQDLVMERIGLLDGFDDAELVQIASSVKNIGHGFDLARAVRFESFMSRDMLEWYYEGSGEAGRLTREGKQRFRAVLLDLAQLGGDEMSRKTAEKIVEDAGSRQDQVALHAIITEALLRDAEAPMHQLERLAYDAVMKQYESGAAAGFRYTPTTQLIPGWARIFQSRCRTQTQTNAALLAIASRRHKLRHGEFPASIDRIDPDLMNFEPIDEYSGELLLYRLAHGQPLIYSTGPDRIDDQAAKPAGSTNWIPIDELGKLDEAERDAISGDIIYFGTP